MRHRTDLVAALFLVISGCTIPYKIPLRTVEINTHIFETGREFIDHVADLKRTLRERREHQDERRQKLTALEAFDVLGISKKHFRELSQEEVKKNLSLPENITSGWTLEQTVKFAERVSLFKGYIFVYTDAKKGGYLGFPKFATEQEGIDARIIILTDGDDVFNIITPGGIVFPEKQGTYWWDFAQDFFLGFVSEGGKETIKQGKKLF